MNLFLQFSLLKKIYFACVFLVGSCIALFAQIKPSVEADVWPAMVRMDYNPILKIKLASTTDTPEMTAIELDFAGTTAPADIASVEAFVGGDAHAASNNEFGSGKISGTKAIISGKETLEGDKEIWISVKLKDKASITGTITLGVASITTDGKKIMVGGKKITQRIGYAIAKRGDLNSKNYRIPGIARSVKTGTLVSVYDIRYNHAGDLPARIDVGFSRSTDNGQTWTPTKVMMTTHNVKGFEDFGNGLGDPTILCDDKTGYFWVAALTSAKKGHPLWSFKGTTSPRDCGQFVLAYSKDDGKTWSKIINITESVKRLKDSDTEAWGCVFQGPGNGICTKDGTLIFPAQVWGHNCGAPHHGLIVYSKDNGKTWKSSKAMSFGGSESTVVELNNGDLMLNTREGAGWWRMVGVTKNLGETWEKHESMNQNETKLRQPGGCQGALLALASKGGRKVFFFSNPNAGSRKNMTIKYSKDDCKTWSKGLLYDERNCAGYSSLSFAGGNRIGVLYEGLKKSENIFFLSIPLKDIVKAK